MCPDRKVGCKPDCNGPVTLQTDIVGSAEGNSTFLMYDVVSTAVEQVCSLDVVERIQPTDWVYDDADVTGMTFKNTPAEFIPDRVLHITN